MPFRTEDPALSSPDKLATLVSESVTAFQDKYPLIAAVPSWRADFETEIRRVAKAAYDLCWKEHHE